MAVADGWEVWFQCADDPREVHVDALRFYVSRHVDNEKIEGVRVWVKGEFVSATECDVQVEV